MQVSRCYSVKTHYAQMPGDDRELEDWLKTQTGVVADTVRTRRDGNELRISFIMSQAVSGRPPIPDFPHARDTFGYGPFADWEDDESQRISE